LSNGINLIIVGTPSVWLVIIDALNPPLVETQAAAAIVSIYAGNKSSFSEN
jgi:hypothetical protein